MTKTKITVDYLLRDLPAGLHHELKMLAVSRHTNIRLLIIELITREITDARATRCSPKTN